MANNTGESTSISTSETSDGTSGDGDGDGDGSPGDGDGSPGDGDGMPGDGDGMPGDGDGSPLACEDANFIGEGIASDGWGIDSFCDTIFFCVTEAEATLFGNLSKYNLVCGGPDNQNICPDQLIGCTVSNGAVIDQALWDELCEIVALGVDTLYCMVLGP